MTPPKVKALPVGGDVTTTVQFFYTHNDDRVLLRLLILILLVLLFLTSFNLFVATYKQYNYTSFNDFLTRNVKGMVGGFLLFWYAFFCFAVWMGRVFGLNLDNNSGAGQLCVSKYERTLGRGDVCWMFGGGAWELVCLE
jgi:hypothetical protein